MEYKVDHNTYIINFQYSFQCAPYTRIGTGYPTLPAGARLALRLPTEAAGHRSLFRGLGPPFPTLRPECDPKPYTLPAFPAPVITHPTKRSATPPYRRPAAPTDTDICRPGGYPSGCGAAPVSPQVPQTDPLSRGAVPRNPRTARRARMRSPETPVRRPSPSSGRPPPYCGRPRPTTRRTSGSSASPCSRTPD